MGTLIVQNDGDLENNTGLCPNKGGLLFSFAARSQHYQIVHCIGCDGGMSGGFALHIPFFHKEEYRKKNHKWEGKGFCSSSFGEEENYYHLVTKESTSDKPTLENLEEALEDFANTVSHRIGVEFHMPQIGCGIDSLDWNDVLPLIDKTARQIDGTITVHILKDYKETAPRKHKVQFRPWIGRDADFPFLYDDEVEVTAKQLVDLSENYSIGLISGRAGNPPREAKLVFVEEKGKTFMQR